MKKFIPGVCLIFIGIGIAIFPWVQARILEHQMNKLLIDWDNGLRPLAAVMPEPDEEDISAGNDNVWEGHVPVIFDSAYVKEHMEGVLTIDKIKLRAPILRPATKKNLDLSICALQYSPAMGQEGNYCLAGHNSRIYGRHLNRLQELRAGDTVKMENEAKTFVYEVKNIFKTTAEDTCALEDTPDQKIATLITCDYSMKPTGRFIVQCELLE